MCILETIKYLLAHICFSVSVLLCHHKVKLPSHILDIYDELMEFLIRISKVSNTTWSLITTFNAHVVLKVALKKG